MPGPPLSYLGISITNAQTVNADDDDFVLSQACGAPFDYYALVVTNLEQLAKSSYEIWDQLQAVVASS